MARLVVAVALVAALAPAAGLEAQTRRRRAPARPAPAPPLTVAPAAVTCPNEMGRGVRTKLVYCDVVAGRNPADGIRVKVPPHTGGARLTFALHNRHLYSEDQIRAGKGYARYTATIGALAMDGTLITRAVVMSEFRTEHDLVDRIHGGGGAPLKAIAPTGTEPIAVEIPADVEEVSLLGEKLEVVRLDGREIYTAPGRLIATVSDVKIQYRPRPPARKPAARKPGARKK